MGSNSISESFKKNPLNLSNIIPLDFEKVPTLPVSHTWTLTTDPPSVDPFAHEPLPVIDLNDPQAVTLIGHACEKWGVFQVTNHDIPISLLNEIEYHSRRLFALPAQRKLLAVRSHDGLTGYGLARISTFFPKLMWFEGFSIMGSLMEHASRLWPHDHTNFCNVMEDYQKEMKDLTERIIEQMFKSLGLAQDDVKWFKPRNGHCEPQAMLQLNSYPVCPDPRHAMGLAPHTDSSLVTLLYQSSISSGLQVLRDNIEWVPVHPIDGALVVNAGDLMHIISNGRFKSALHRAVVNKTHHRISIAYFYGPPRDIKISPSVKLIDHDHPILYRPVTWKEYLDAKATHFNKALEFIRHDVLVANTCNQS
ncbi:2OG-FeII_Oxy domain-containing protein/DIOX_N domain-containing protein [Cephalotus follicularis]|uniref:gibberellin 3beta-dioxygenase n=1 Tax=Cephalotus follicularis TaxID=3775 RepID=A0A1Q3D883_CEPFO|nr:2OG-FeII_Oxy domain-containing protein/DIOX_N domain-containing protein [Cephalotus follicularis]